MFYNYSEVCTTVYTLFAFDVQHKCTILYISLYTGCTSCAQQVHKCVYFSSDFTVVLKICDPLLSSPVFRDNVLLMLGFEQHVLFQE